MSFLSLKTTTCMEDNYQVMLTRYENNWNHPEEPGKRFFGMNDAIVEASAVQTLESYEHPVGSNCYIRNGVQARVLNLNTNETIFIGETKIL